MLFSSGFQKQEKGMEQKSADSKGRMGEGIWIVPLEDVMKQPGRRTWKEGREEPGNGMCWEVQEQDSLKRLHSPQTRWGKEASLWEDAKAFLASFEQVAQACQWPREEWVARLLPALSGETQKIFSSLKARDKEDYGKVKAAILHREANHVETLRQHFRQFRSQEVEDPRRIYSQLQELCHRWLRPERHSKEQILELLILEQFLAFLPPELQSWIRAGNPENCTQATALMEDFLLSQPRVSKPRKWKGAHVDHLGLQETLLDPAEMQSYKEAEQAEISLPEGNGTLRCPCPSFSLPPERQESTKGWQMEEDTCLEVVLKEALMPPEETAVFLQKTEQHLTQHQGQRTKFWQVLPDSSGKVNSLERLLVPKADLPFRLEKEEDLSVRFLEERRAFTSQDSGDEKGSQFKVENPSCGANKPGDAEMPQGDMLVPAEIEVEICESKVEWGKKSLQGQNESQDLSEDLGAVCSQIHEEHQRKEEPLFSRYGRKYQLKSRFVMELTRGECDECSTSEENSDLDEPQRISIGKKSNTCAVRGSSCKRVNLKRNQSDHMRERKYFCAVCENSFTPKTFVRHLKIHGEHAANPCPMCGKRMKSMYHMNRHLRLHTGEKPFKCSKCRRSFSRSDSLLNHQRNHGRKMLHECSQCGKGFCRRSLMVNHQKSHK